MVIEKSGGAEIETKCETGDASNQNSVVHKSGSENGVESPAGARCHGDDDDNEKLNGAEAGTGTEESRLSQEREQLRE